jgi:hypothetical protein
MQRRSSQSTVCEAGGSRGIRRKKRPRTSHHCRLAYPRPQKVDDRRPSIGRNYAGFAVKLEARGWGVALRAVEDTSARVVMASTATPCTSRLQPTRVDAHRVQVCQLGAVTRELEPNARQTCLRARVLGDEWEKPTKLGSEPFSVTPRLSSGAGRIGDGRKVHGRLVQPARPTANRIVSPGWARKSASRRLQSFAPPRA